MIQKQVAKTIKINQVQTRYSACSEAVEVIDVMLAMDKILKRCISKVFPQEYANAELSKARTVIRYDLLAMRDELSDEAVELAEYYEEVRAGKDAETEGEWKRKKS